MLCTEGGWLAEEDFAGRLGPSRAEVIALRARGEVFWMLRESDVVYPRFQVAHEGGLLPVIAEVGRALAGLGPAVRLDVVLAPDERLGGLRPLDALRLGDVEGAVRAARGFVEGP